MLSWWPGYLIETHAQPVEKLENHFSFYVENKLSKAEIARYKIMTSDEISNLINKRKIRIALVNSVWTPNKESIKNLLDTAGFELIKKAGDLDIYMLRVG